MVKQVDRGLEAARQQVGQLQQESRGLFAGLKAGWQAWKRSSGSSDAIHGEFYWRSHSKKSAMKYLEKQP